MGSKIKAKGTEKEYCGMVNYLPDFLTLRVQATLTFIR